VLPVKYASRTINHQLSVLFGFYEFACTVDLGPMVNPVPAQRAAHGGRLYAHHNPMEDLVIHRRATYRQKVPRPAWRAISDDAADALFAVLRSNRDRALVSFWLSDALLMKISSHPEPVSASCWASGCWPRAHDP
jgi:hypothetical protein